MTATEIVALVNVHADILLGIMTALLS